MTREVPYTVQVPETKQETYNVTTYRSVPVTSTQDYNVSVPYTEQEEYTVQTCVSVPQTVQVPVITSASGAVSSIDGGGAGGGGVIINGGGGAGSWLRMWCC